MNTELSQENVDFYRENGFLVKENLINSEELSYWSKLIDQAVEKRKNKRILGKDSDSVNEFYDQVFVQRINLWQSSPEIKPFTLQAEIGKMATKLSGASGIRLQHDQALYKEPWSNQTTLHRDNPYWSFHVKNSLSIWIALDDSTLENGCMYFIPGSHKIDHYESSRIGPNMKAVFDVSPEFENTAAQAVPLKAGSCTFHNGLTIHGAGPNFTTKTRRAFVICFMPQGSTFNGSRNTYTDEYAQQLKVGQELNDEEVNPLIYAES